MLQGKEEEQYLDLLEFRWWYQVLGDLRTMPVTGRGTHVKDRITWRLIVEEAKAYPGL